MSVGYNFQYKLRSKRHYTQSSNELWVEWKHSSTTAQTELCTHQIRCDSSNTSFHLTNSLAIPWKTSMAGSAALREPSVPRYVRRLRSYYLCVNCVQQYIICRHFRQLFSLTTVCHTIDRLLHWKHFFSKAIIAFIALLLNDSSVAAKVFLTV